MSSSTKPTKAIHHPEYVEYAHHHQAHMSLEEYKNAMKIPRSVHTTAVKDTRLLLKAEGILKVAEKLAVVQGINSAVQFVEGYPAHIRSVIHYTGVLAERYKALREKYNYGKHTPKSDNIVVTDSNQAGYFTVVSNTD